MTRMRPSGNEPRDAEPPPHKYNGARAMIILHERHVRAFLKTWRDAKAVNLTLPRTGDPAYKSHEALLHHVCRAARGYMTWMCEVLGLPDPEIPAPPEPEGIEMEVDAYLERLLDRWRTPLSEVEESRFEEEFPCRWGPTYCIDAMLEHAVMHPIRHDFQLKTLLERRSR